MKKRILKAERTSDNLTRLIWEDDSGQRRVEEYLFSGGSVVWPHEIYPGIILMAGQEEKTERVTIFEEKEFRSLSEGIHIFEGLWDQYQPTYYFFNDLPENLGFIRHLRVDERIQEKTPFGCAFNARNLDFGNQLIKEFLGKNNLSVPAGGILAVQLQANWADSTSSIENLYGIEALRYLLEGILTCPFEPAKKELRRPPKDGSEVAWLELEEIRKGLEVQETDW
jgi:hypothetical protein